MGSIIELSDDNFDEEVLNFSGVVLVDFWAEWCPPCRRLMPIIEEIFEEYKDRIKICKLNVDKAGAVAHRFSIKSVPTIKFFKDGKELYQIIGLVPKQDITAKIEALLQGA